MQFQCSEVREERQVVRVGNETVAILTSLRTISPAEVAKETLESWLFRSAFQKDGNWCIKLSGLDILCSASDLQALLAEVADQLNLAGVSVKGWASYELNED
jgi:hypothetical protein